MAYAHTFIDRENVDLLRKAIEVDLGHLRTMDFAILDSYISEEMKFFKNSLPLEKLEITSIRQGFNDNGFRYELIDSSDPNNIERIHGKDFAFLNLYGEYGEDGRVQGLLDYLNVKYNGSGVIGSALFIDKLIAKVLLQSQGHLTASYMSKRLASDARLLPPVMLKTYRGGSSVRMRHITDEVPAQIEEDCFLEQFIDGRLLTVSFIENRGHVFTLPPLEVSFHESSFYDDVSKVNRTTSYSFPDVGESERRQIEVLLRDAYELMALRNYGRIDFILREGKLFFLEINTIPGLLNKGNYALCFKNIGVDYPEMLSMIISSALEKQEY